MTGKTDAKYIIGRLSRITGHLRHVKDMVENGRDCSDVLIQLSAVEGNLSSVSKVLLTTYLDECVANMEQSGDKEALEQFKKAFISFSK